MSLLSIFLYVCAALDPCAPVGVVDCDRHTLSQRARDGALCVCAGTACVWQLGARVWRMCSPALQRPALNTQPCLSVVGGRVFCAQGLHRLVPMRRRGPHHILCEFDCV